MAATQTDADKAKAEAAKKAEADKKAKAEAQAKAKAEREEAAAKKRAEKEAEKERKAKERAEAKAKRDAEREAEKERKRIERENRPKAIPMTLSQRRAALRLLEGPVTTTTDFNALPFRHLVEHNLATAKDVEVKVGEGDDAKTVKGVEFKLTEAGTERAKAVNPKWRDWKADKPTKEDAKAS